MESNRGRSGNRLKKLRLMQRLSLEDIAAARGVSRSTAHRWEQGEVQIPDSHKTALAELFGVSVTFLLGWERWEGKGDGENGDDQNGEAAA